MEIVITSDTSDFNREDIVLDVVFSDSSNIHTSFVVAICGTVISNNTTYVMPLSHYEDNTTSSIDRMKMSDVLSNEPKTFDVIGWECLFDKDLITHSMIDIRAYQRHIGSSQISNKPFENLDHNQDRYYYYYTPLSKIAELHYNHCKQSERIINQSVRASSQDTFHVLSKIERNGLYIKDENNKRYSRYNLFTSTGRPSNARDKINYAAIEDRQAFMGRSRYGQDGMYVTFDFKSYHLYLASHLIHQYGISDENVLCNTKSDIYEMLKKSKSESRSDVKRRVFKRLYNTDIGGAKSGSFIHYIDELKMYVYNDMYMDSTPHHIKTPVHGRIIKNIPNPNIGKVFNYFMQAYETEVSMKKIHTLLFDYFPKTRSFRKLSGQFVTPILYTYDSITVDTTAHEKTINNIKKVLSTEYCYTPCKVHAYNIQKKT